MAIIYLTQSPECPAPRCRMRLLPEGFFPPSREKRAGNSSLCCVLHHVGFFMRLRLRGAPVGSYPTFSPLLAGLVVSSRLSVLSQNSLKPLANRRFGAFSPTPVSFFFLATENRQLTTSPAGGLFSVTLSVTRDSHPKYPRFHEACRPSVFGLSSGEKFAPAITCHSRKKIP